MWEVDNKDGWAPKNWCFQTVVLEKTPESSLDWKEPTSSALPGGFFLFVGLEGAAPQGKQVYCSCSRWSVVRLGHTLRLILLDGIGVGGALGCVDELKIWNALQICTSSLCRGHANLLCVVPVWVYVLPKPALPGGFFTTEPPGEPLFIHFLTTLNVHVFPGCTSEICILGNLRNRCWPEISDLHANKQKPSYLYPGRTHT